VCIDNFWVNESHRESDQIAGAPELKNLSGSTVLHHMFSRGPDELLSPHVRAQWSISKYSHWLDEHAEEDVWRVVQSSLEAYAAKVNSRGDTAFDPIYPIMVAYLKELQQGGIRS